MPLLKWKPASDITIYRRQRAINELFIADERENNAINKKHRRTLVSTPPTYAGNGIWEDLKQLLGYYVSPTGGQPNVPPENCNYSGSTFFIIYSIYNEVNDNSLKYIPASNTLTYKNNAFIRDTDVTARIRIALSSYEGRHSQSEVVLFLQGVFTSIIGAFPPLFGGYKPSIGAPGINVSAVDNKLKIELAPGETLPARTAIGLYYGSPSGAFNGNGSTQHGVSQAGVGNFGYNATTNPYATGGVVNKALLIVNNTDSGATGLSATAQYNFACP